MAKYYIVWNRSKTEGFVTDDARDANFARGVRNVRGHVTSTVGEAFRETYFDDDGGDDDCLLPMTELDLQP